ncbi:hypothetical protein RhiLY_14485 [Ceratobasidium sp. AG-Ba]|nr:hypothetical protein RhiLY_14485 [Ceratobasidium sp. AG-Ba]
MDQPPQRKQKFIPGGPTRPSNGAASQRAAHSCSTKPRLVRCRFGTHRRSRVGPFRQRKCISSKSESRSDNEEMAGAEPAAVIDLLSSNPPCKRKDVTKLSQAELNKNIARLQTERDRRAREPSEAPSATSSRIVVTSLSKHGQKVAVKIEEGEATILKDVPGEEDEKRSSNVS